MILQFYDCSPARQLRQHRTAHMGFIYRLLQVDPHHRALTGDGLRGVTEEGLREASLVGHVLIHLSLAK